MTTDSWYKPQDTVLPLSQGDIFFKFDVIEHPIEEGIDLTIESEIPTAIVKKDLVVISQSCDLEHNKLENIIFCEVFALDIVVKKILDKDTFLRKNPDKEKIVMELLRRGHFLAYRLLNKCEIQDHTFDYLVVDLKNPISLDLKYVNTHIKKYKSKIQLNHPYCEHLSQSFAFTFMRVGLPVDIDPFFKLKDPTLQFIDHE